MLDTEGKNIDAVMVAASGPLAHPHVAGCMQQGKHVYCEKPLTRTVWEARLLADAAVKYKVATQMGNQGFNHEGTKTACEILWSGEIGDVRKCMPGPAGSPARKYPGSRSASATRPGEADWDLWLGPAAERPYNADDQGWRAFIDFSAGGTLGDWLVHILGPAHLALQLGTALRSALNASTWWRRTSSSGPSRRNRVSNFRRAGICRLSPSTRTRTCAANSKSSGNGGR